MKKIFPVIAIGFGGLVALLIVAKITGILTWYKMPTPANEPTLKVDRSYFVSNLKQPERGNFIVFRDPNVGKHLAAADPDWEKKNPPNAMYVKRLCGMPNDKIEMINGILFVNGKNLDQNYSLKVYYTTTMNEIDKSGFDLDSLDQYDYQNLGPGNSGEGVKLMLNLDDNQAAFIRKIGTLQRYINADTTNVFNWLPARKGFTVDNFGPIIIPPDQYFVLGDNRHNSLDSRYTGFIDQKNIFGVVLNK